MNISASISLAIASRIDQILDEHKDLAGNVKEAVRDGLTEAVN